MLTSIKLGNFKAFDPTQTIPIKPITMIFGPNSTGKSSIIHSLLLAHQAAVVDGELDVHYPRLSGSTVDLGGFAGYVHRHQTGSPVNWACEFSADQRADRLPKSLLKDVQSFSCRSKLARRSVNAWPARLGLTRMALR